MSTLFALIGARCLLCTFYLVALLHPQLQTNQPIIVDKDTARRNSDSITFSLTARSSTPIERAILIHGVESNTCLGSSQARRELDFEARQQIETTWDWDLTQSGNLPPGATIWWQWELHDRSGAVLVSDRRLLTIEDTSLPWQKIETPALTVYWSKGDRQFGYDMFQIAEQSLERLAKNAGLVMREPIRIMIYPSSAAMKNALISTSDWAGGIAFSAYNVVLIGIAPGETDWAAESIPHELSHLVTGKRIYNCSTSDLPTWLSEGLADYATGPTQKNDQAAVLAALKAGNLPALSSLANGFAADGAIATRSYHQSHMVVEFMINQYGAETISALLDLIRDGRRIDPALREIYGLDTTGLDQTWRASLGFGAAPSASFHTPTPAGQPTVIPTLPLFSPLSSPTATQVAGSATPSPAPATQTPTPVRPSVTPLPPSEPASGPAKPSSLLIVGISSAVIVIAGAATFFLRRRR